MNLLQAMDDPKLFGPWFRDPASWRAWRVFIAALFGLPMAEDDRELFRQCTGRDEPSGPQGEAWLIVGRRGGKSFVMALIGVFLSTFRDYREHLQPGERATVLVLAADRRQARVIFRYASAMIARTPMLRRMLQRETTSEFDLDNGVTLEVGTSDYRAVRGRTLAAALCDEIAFWSAEDSTSPDYEILDALRPAMATIPNGLLLVGSSPYAKRGALHDAFRRYFGKADAPALVWKAPTKVMNPRISDRVIAKAYERDAAIASAEFGAEFRTDVESLVPREVVEACVLPGLYERAPASSIFYAGFVDPSGGSADSMTLAIAHREGDRAILDAVRERRPPFSPDDVVQEFAALLRSYGLSSVTGDRYGGEWPRERFRVHGISYEVADRTKSTIYADLLPLLNAGRAELLDHQRLIDQLIGLERRTARGGRDSIDHAPGGHDDIANAVAGALVGVAFGGGFNLEEYLKIWGQEGAAA